MAEESNWYVRACKTTVRQWGWVVQNPSGFSKQCEKSVSQEYRDALRFTGFDLEAFETVLFSYAGTVATLILLLGIDLIILFSKSFEARTLTIMGILTFIIPLGVLYYLSEYVKIRAKLMKISSLGDIPEILSYIVMSMKLVPQPGTCSPFCSREL